jgi:hypothetical protein
MALRKAAMRGHRPRKLDHSERPFRKRVVILKKCADREVFTHFFCAGIIPPLGIARFADDSR